MTGKMRTGSFPSVLDPVCNYLTMLLGEVLQPIISFNIKLTIHIYDLLKRNHVKLNTRNEFVSTKFQGEQVRFISTHLNDVCVDEGVLECIGNFVQLSKHQMVI